MQQTALTTSPSELGGVHPPDTLTAAGRCCDTEVGRSAPAPATGGAHAGPDRDHGGVRPAHDCTCEG
ncbi:hypothetical protein [uncultured Kocuria sp.]|uniref:hypothetical protein n=1 Tax=uncultured Kocuria sp. TaxID=259305 RepID=UPI002619AC52|nr:hypothetical protein [uncultured Kocuria sp.]